MKVKTYHIAVLISLLSVLLFGMLWWMAEVPTLLAVGINWAVILTTILLEVGGISILLNKVVLQRTQQRLESQRQLALRRAFKVLYSTVLSYLKTGRLIEIFIRLSGPGNGKLQDLIKFNAIRVSRISERAMERLDRLFERFSELFETEFMTRLMELVEVGYGFSEGMLAIESGYSISEALGSAVSERAMEASKDIFDRVIGSNLESWKQLVGEFELKVVQFIEEQIYPSAEPLLKEEINRQMSFLQKTFDKLND